jgi:hypothetical protein
MYTIEIRAWPSGSAMVLALRALPVKHGCNRLPVGVRHHPLKRRPAPNPTVVTLDIVRVTNVRQPSLGNTAVTPDGVPAADPKWGPYLDARSRVVAELADQVRLNAEGEAPAWAAEPNAHMPAELIADVQMWRAATRVDAGDLHPPATPARPRHPNLPTATRQAARRHGYLRRPAMAATARHRSPSATADSFLPELAERLSNLARAGFDATLLVRSAATAGPYPMTTRRRPLVAHPRSATANAEPRPRHPRGSPSDSAHDHEITRPAATQAARRRLPRSAQAAENVDATPAKCFAGPIAEPSACSRSCLAFIRCGLRHFGERRLGKEVQTTFGGMPLTCAITMYPQGGTPGGGTKAVMPPPHD